MHTDQELKDLKDFAKSPLAKLIGEFEASRCEELTEVVMLKNNSVDSLVASNVDKGMLFERREGTLPMAISWLEGVLVKQKQSEKGKEKV